MSEGNGKTPVRITITLDGEVYEKIQEISNTVGLRPATWISMLTTSKINNLEMQIRKSDETSNSSVTQVLRYSHP